MHRRYAPAVAVLLIYAAPAASQFPFGGGSGGGRGGFSAMLSNPDLIFNFLSKGKDTIDRRELDPQFRGMADRFFSMANLNGDIITRDQFKTAFQQVMQQFTSGGGAAMMGMFGGGGGRGGFPGGPGSGPGGPGGPGIGGFGRGDRGGFNPDTIAERIFQRYDGDGDGLLKIEEMPESLAIERDKWDTNNDGFIDLREYKEFFTARRQQIESERAAATASNDNSANGASPTPDNERRPIVYRANNLPRELPSWFAQADANQDAQVSLLEWRGTNMPIDQFKSMDRNGDNLLTVDEVLIFQKLNKNSNLVASAGGRDGAPGETGGSPAGFGNFGGFGGGGFPGAGGFGGFGGFGGDRGGRGGRGDRAMGGFGGFGGIPSGGFPGSGFPGAGNSQGGAFGGGFPSGGFGGFGGDRGGRGGRGDRATGGFPSGGPGSFGGQGGFPSGGGFPGTGFPSGGDRGGFGGDRGGRNGGRNGPPGGDNFPRGGRNRGG
jgi:hypothetical protein